MQRNKLQSWVDKEVKKELDKEPFSSLPRKMRIGIFLLAGSYLIGYAFPPLIVLAANADDKLAAGLAGGGFFYAVSWVIGLTGIALAGRSSIKYPLYFSAKFLKWLFPRYFAGKQRQKPSFSPFAMVNVISLLLLAGFTVLLFLRFSIYWLIAAGAVIAVHQVLYIYGMFASRSNYFFKTVKGKEFFSQYAGKFSCDDAHTGGDVLLRFDDGPDPVYTPIILDILKAESIRAMFAITGENAEKYPHIVKRIHDENHVIGNHTFTHPYNILLVGYKKMFYEVSRTNVIIEEITGSAPVFFCPPIGQKNPIMGRVIRDLDLIPVMWDIRTYDTRRPAAKIAAAVRKNLKPPSIILLHDGILPWTKTDREATAAALKEIIHLIKST
jgi:peptidoglycan/xylan/chitin deacetylase (PgdA/CDA1 family)